MNDHRNHRRHSSEPAWPTGDAPSANREQPEERTGFWSPLWEEDDDEPAGRPNGHSRNGTNGSHSTGANGSNGSAHRWPEAEQPSVGSHRHDPPAPRPAPRAAAPVWPGQEAPQGPPPGGRRPGGPPAPTGPNGFPGPAGTRPPSDQTTRVVRPRPPGGVDPDGPTELLPSVRGGRGAGGTGPEPQLLTHREPDYDEDVNDDPDLDDDHYDEDSDGALSEEERKKRRKKKIWKRVRRTMYVLTALMIIGPMVAFFVAYQMVEVPSPQSVAATQGQVVTLTYNNDAPLSKVVPEGGNRTMVRYDQIPKTVLHAVYAAEDAEFETNPGFDITGVLQAGWNQVTAGTGGGSTITQQYIKKATGNEEKSISRKALEIVKAYKMNNTYSKEDIITAYLNTIYFGRSAYGIEAATKAYYGPDKTLDQLTPAEAALLAGMIQSPGRDKDDEYMHRRWNFVMDQMVDKNWLKAADRKAATFPTTSDPSTARPTAAKGPSAHIQTQVFDELERETGVTLDKAQQLGLTIHTTIDPFAQQMVQDSIQEVMADQPTNLFPAVVAVDPKTGRVMAYYGGSNGYGTDFAMARQEPGSSFKPFDLVALLEQGDGLGKTYDGTSGRVLGGRKVRNSSNDSKCGTECTVAEAMKRSVNTVFYDMALNTVGTQKVADAAKAAGVTSPLEGENGGPPDANISIGGGKTQVSTLEMASAYATFAANGTYRKPHLITSVTYGDGGVFWQPDEKVEAGGPAFDKGNPENNKKIARNVTESLKPVIEYSKMKCATGHECAGKTGTHQFGATEDNAKAWMVGYTPQVSAAVSMGAQDEANNTLPLKNAKGDIIYGSGLPGKIWQTFMNKFLKDKPKEGFGKFEPIGKEPPKDTSQSNKPSGDKPNGSQPQNQPSNSQSQTQPTETDPTDTTDPSATNDPVIPPIGGPNGNRKPPGQG